MIVGERVVAVAMAEGIEVGDALAAVAGATVGDVVGAGASADGTEAWTRDDEVIAADPSSARPWLWPANSWLRLCSTETAHAGARFVPSTLR